jgi:hypothetical protein
MFIAALFTVAKPWKLPRCPTIDEYAMIFYSVVKNKNFVTCR